MCGICLMLGQLVGHVSRFALKFRNVYQVYDIHQYICKKNVDDYSDLSDICISGAGIELEMATGPIRET